MARDLHPSLSPRVVLGARHAGPPAAAAGHGARACMAHDVEQDTQEDGAQGKGLCMGILCVQICVAHNNVPHNNVPILTIT